MQIERHFHADRINEIVNHPDVYPWVRGSLDGALDLSPVLADRRNVLLMGEHGGVLFSWVQSGLYEAHTQVLPEGRGPGTIDMVRAALTWMFCRTDACEILTRCPEGNIAAKTLARAIHGEFAFTATRGWVRDGAIIPADVFSFSVQSWARRASGLVERGQWFHDALEREYRRIGKPEPIHPDDEWHDRYVGAAFEMMFGGQPEKAVSFYNRWALLSNYEPIALVSQYPITVDIREAVLRLDGHELKVI